MWAAPASWGGILDFNRVVTLSGAGTFSWLGIGLVQPAPGGILSLSSVMPLPFTSVAATGSVATGSHAGTLACHKVPAGETNFASVMLQVPPRGDTQATLALASLTLICSPQNRTNYAVGMNRDVNDALTRDR
jgi:hypothetical protein